MARNWNTIEKEIACFPNLDFIKDAIYFCSNILGPG
jgi:hypothetical protein